MNKKMLVIINPCAGRAKSKQGTFDIVDILSTLDYDFHLKTTTKRGDATDYAKNLGNDYDVILCCGGDGTLNETVNGVMQLPERKSVGYIPTGSTNDLATTIGIPEDIRSAVQLIVTDQKNQYDIGLFNDRYFNYIATFGVGSEFSYMTPQKMKNVLGHSAYLIDSFILHLPRIFKSLKPVHMVVEYDGGVIEDDFIFGSVSNSTSVGGIFTFSRDDIRLNDGEFELLLARNVKSFAGAVELLMKVQKHNYDCNELIFTKTKKLKIHSSKPVAWSLDGEYGGEHSEAEISVLNNAIEIFSRKNDLFE